MLSLSVPDYPGWEAQLNGEPVEIIRAYAALMAIEVPAGQHRITLTFAPLTYAVGAVISALTWLGAALLWLSALRRS